MKKVKNNKAITLISLVVTIIVMIILAGVGINITIGNNGIFTRAKETKKAQRIAEYTDWLEIGKANVITETEGTGNLEDLKKEYENNIVPTYFSKGSRVTEVQIDEDLKECLYVISGENDIFKITFDKVILVERYILIGTITCTEAEWNSETHKASIMATKNTTNPYFMQYQVNTIDENEWITIEGSNVSQVYTFQITDLELNDVVYMRLFDSGVTAATCSYTVDDSIEPTVTVNLEEKTTNTIKVSVESIDNEAGMPSEPEYTFYLKQSDESDDKYVEKQTGKDNTCSFEGLTQNKNYSIKVTTNDLAGNLGEGIQDITTNPIPVATDNIDFGTPVWEKNEHTATVTLSKKTGVDSKFDIQYQIYTNDEDLQNNSKWITGTTISGIADKIIYARLWDGISGGTPEYKEISTIPISNTTISLAIPEGGYSYNGSAKEPAVTVKDGETTLTSGTHYEVTYSNNIDAGTEAKATISGYGQYTGSVDKTFDIGRIDGGITLSATSGSVKYGSTTTFTVDTNISGGTLSVKSEDTTKATASISGNTVTVKGEGVGTTTITVTSETSTNYNVASATYKITINKADGKVELSATSGTVYVGSTTTFTVKTNISGGTLTVKSSATGYTTASISNTTVTLSGKANGTATITVTSAATANYNAASATYTATVSTYSLAKEYNYSGTVQTLNITQTGLYKLECYGASGSADEAGKASGGKGGYAVGYMKINAGTTLYICVGKVGTNDKQPAYNGGGKGGNYGVNRAGGGGGATHIATATGELASLSSNKSAVLIVAGGGGGAGRGAGANGGAGGGTSGGAGAKTSGASSDCYPGGGGTQTAGGTNSKDSARNGSFGTGGRGSSSTACGGGGAGYFGGAAGLGAYGSGGGGGSSFFKGGFTSMTYGGTTYTSSTTAGQRSGNGYAKITFVKY